MIQQRNRPRASLPLLGGLAVAAGLTWSGSASSSTDEKSVSAAVCKPVAGEDPSNMYMDAFGRIYNLHGTQSLDVICPLVRDNVHGTDGIHSGKAYVDNPTTGTLECILASVSEAGTVLDFDIQDTGQTSGWDVLEFDEIEPSAQNGTYHVRCILPAHFGSAGTPPIEDLTKLGSINIREHN